jgi:hypothetical protein
LAPFISPADPPDGGSNSPSPLMIAAISGLRKKMSIRFMGLKVWPFVPPS